MCGRLACTLCPEDIQKACTYVDKNGKSVEPKWVDGTGYTYKPFYNGPPSIPVPVLLYKSHFPKSETDSSPDYSICSMKWGYISPHQFKPNVVTYAHNSRIENLMKSKVYKPVLLAGNRCVVLAEGFYEWQIVKHVDDKQPYFIYQNPYESETTEEGTTRRKYLMKLAGLFKIEEIDCEKKYTCIIFTTEAHSSLKWLHYRMPLILNNQQEIDDWLNYKTVNSTAAVQAICKAYLGTPDKPLELKYYKVDKKYVNNAASNDVKCMQRMTVKRVNTLDSWLIPNKK